MTKWSGIWTTTGNWDKDGIDEFFLEFKQALEEMELNLEHQKW